MNTGKHRPVPEWRFAQANAFRLDMLADGEADVVCTSPPYFPAALDATLRRPLAQQTDFGEVERDAVAYAFSLRPAFREIGRVLKTTGVLILQTKDLRYGGSLIGIADVHRELVEASGLRLQTRIFWVNASDSRRHIPRLSARRRGGVFRTYDVEEFQVYGRPYVCRPNGPTGVTGDAVRAARSPVWRLPGAGRARAHPYQSPATVIRRLLALYSTPGDLVIDPFAGSGTVLKVALQMQRRAAGCELDASYAAGAERTLRDAQRRGR